VPESPTRSRRSLILAALVCAAWGAYVSSGVSLAKAWGWDEAMHAEYPALRMLLAARGGEWRLALHALHDCQQYPFVHPLYLACVQAATGVSEHACRFAGRWLWAAGCFGLFLLGRALCEARAARAGAGRRGDELVPWLLLAGGLTCPLALDYSGTLFLEVPFVTAEIFALRAWVLRGLRDSLRHELATGALLALCLFVKFNYGLLLGGALALDLALEGVAAARGGSGRRFAARCAALAAVPALALAWWFLLPLPEGQAMAASHRDALVQFLGGNRDPSMYTPWSTRCLHWTCFLVFAPRVLLVLAAGMARTLPSALRTPVRTLWIAFVVPGVLMALHPFHLDRFLLPGAPLIWSLAALGLAPWLPKACWARAAALAGLGAFCAVAPALDGMAVVRAVGLENEAQRPYQLRALADWRSLRADRLLQTNGFWRDEYEALLDLLAREVRPQDRVGWLPVTNVFPPAAMEAGLLERGVDVRAEILRGRLHEAFFELSYADPHWTPEQLADWARGFTLILTTRPVDMTGNPGRAFMQKYQALLLEGGAWTPTLLGAFEVKRPLHEPLPVEVYGCRPSP